MDHEGRIAKVGEALEGLGGVRTEDCVLVTEDGADVLGSAAKDQLLEVLTEVPT